MPPDATLASGGPVGRSAASDTTASGERVLGSARGGALLGLLVGLFCWLHWDFMVRTVLIGLNDADWSHVIVVPFFSAYYVWQNRDRILATPNTISLWGLPLLLLGMFNYVWWIYPGRNDWFRGYSMVLTLLGLVLLLCGWQRTKLLLFPILFLAFAVKLPGSVWERIAFQMQIFAVAGARALLAVSAEVLNFSIEWDAQAFTMRWISNAGVPREETLTIAEACSGLRMMMAFCALSVAVAFLHPRRWWQRVIMIGMAVPIAVGINVVRVTTLGLLNLVNPELARGDFHVFVGLLMLVPAGLLFLLLGWVLDRILIEDERADGDADGNVNPADATTLPTPAPGGVASDDAAFTRPAWLIGGAIAGLLFLAAGAGVFLLGFLNLEPLVLVPTLPAIPPAPLLPAAVAALAVLGWVLWRRRGRGAGVRRADGGGAARAGGRTLAVPLAVALAFGCGVLGAAAASLQTALAYTEAVLIKESVPLRHSLLAIPTELPGPGLKRWVMTREEPPLPKDIEAELGTDRYVTRQYALTDQPTLHNLGQAEAVVQVHIAYYTGMIDTVPHVPDRCWVAGDWQPGPSVRVPVTLTPHADPRGDGASGQPLYAVGMPDPVTGERVATLPADAFNATRFTGTQTRPREVQRSAVYFFVANGNFYASPNQVRAQAFNATDRYSYYCKVEVTPLTAGDPDAASEIAERFLSSLMPELMGVLPDWQQVTTGQWPLD